MANCELNEIEMTTVNGGAFESIQAFIVYTNALESGDYARAREYYYDQVENGADENLLYTWRELYKLYTGEGL